MPSGLATESEARARAPEIDREHQRREAGAGLSRILADLNARYPEREALLEQIGVALVAREHVLVFGPPGTGKSELAASILRRLLDASGRPSLFARQIVETTVQTDLVGPVDFKTLTETGRTVHHLDEGMLCAPFAVLDEVFDGRDLLLRSILSVLNERELALGATVHRAALQTALLTTNRFLSEVLAARPDTLQAFTDRIAFSSFVPMAFGDPESRDALLKVAAEGRADPGPTLPIAALTTLNAATREVGLPEESRSAIGLLFDTFAKMLSEATAERKGFVPTTVFSPRTLVKAVNVLRAAVVLDRYVRGNDRALRIGVEDLARLKLMVTLGGPSADALPRVAEATRDPRERWQLENVRLEQTAFDRAFSVVAAEVARLAEREAKAVGLPELRARAKTIDPVTAGELAVAATEGLSKVRSESHRDELRTIARAAARAYARASQSGTLPQLSFSERPLRLRTSVMLARALAGDGEAAAAAQQLAAGALGEAHAVLSSVASGEAGGEFEVGPVPSLSDLADRATGLARRIQEIEALGAELEPLSRNLYGNGPAIATAALEARRRAARSLRRRAMVLLGGSSQEVEGWKALAEASRLIAPLDQALEKLSAGEGTARSHLLAARAGVLLSADLASLSETRLGELADVLKRGLSRIEALGVEGARALRICHPQVERHLAAFRLSFPQTGFPEGTASEEGYLELVARCEAGSHRAALARIAGLAGMEDRSEPKALDRHLAQVDLNELSAQVSYLAKWLEQVIACVPPPESLASREDAEQAWAEVSATRFFAVGWRDHDLGVLQGRIQALGRLTGLTDDARQILAALDSVAATAERFGRALLERRAELAAAA